jgi:hypothetical protein
MNGTGTRRSLLATHSESAPPVKLFTAGVLPVQILSSGHGKGKNLVRGLSVQIAYGAIDAILVCLVGAFLVWVRFGLRVPFATSLSAYDQFEERAYAGFFLLYATLVVLGCATKVFTGRREIGAPSTRA